ncbi:amidase [Thalassotalea euphylliae]|uniref:Amidase n=1 Tax=Thalassotalea euphylliae TaxID=1655234 RepID=A0A3E0TSK8_9GAMM|nr:amidase family protein [Thalassotalea euphylliae]REL27626.1 amidase [Thalassotalea euphylliae]
MKHDSAIFCSHGPKAWQARESGDLAGLRLAVKDLFAVAGHKNSAGNPEWLRQAKLAEETASSVHTLMMQGCQFVGYTQTDELAYSLEGNNSHYGAAQNPKLAGHSCGGSSMGSAAAVAAGLADIGLGTDTGGSIRVPASYCGLYGIRPTHGAISAHGLTPLAPAFDTTGWLTHSAELLVKVGNHLLPKQSVYQVEQLFVCEQLFDLLPSELAGALSNKLDEIAPHFAQVKQFVLPSEGLLSELADTFRILQGREIARTHGKWLSALSPDYRDYFAPAIGGRFEMALALSEAEEVQAKQVQQKWCDVMQQLTSGLKSAMTVRSALFLPTTPSIAPKLGADTSELRAKILTLTAIAGLSGSAQVHIPDVSIAIPDTQLLDCDGSLLKAPYGYSLLMAPHNDRSLLELVSQLSE